LPADHGDHRRHSDDAAFELPTNTDRQAYSLDDYIDSATSVVTARFDRLAAHFAAPEAVDLLAKDLEGIIAFLP
jgi:hypothetical protein